MLVGDTITDRPLNGAPGLAIGYLFHDSSLGDCSIYCKDGWEPFCSGESGTSGSGGLAILKWYGSASSFGPTAVYLADSSGSSQAEEAYPIVDPRTVEHFSANLVSVTLGGGATGVYVQLYDNGVAVAGTRIDLTSAGEIVSLTLSPPYVFAASHTIDVGIASDSSAMVTAAVVSATAEMS